MYRVEARDAGQPMAGACWHTPDRASPERRSMYTPDSAGHETTGTTTEASPHHHSAKQPHTIPPAVDDCNQAVNPQYPERDVDHLEQARASGDQLRGYPHR